MKEPDHALSHEFVKLIAEIDEFKGRWQALENLSPDRLSTLRRLAIVESVGSSTRIECANLSDPQVETLSSNLDRSAFFWRDEQEVAGYMIHPAVESSSAFPATLETSQTKPNRTTIDTCYQEDIRPGILTLASTIRQYQKLHTITRYG